MHLRDLIVFSEYLCMSVIFKHIHKCASVMHDQFVSDGNEDAGYSSSLLPF